MFDSEYFSQVMKILSFSFGIISAGCWFWSAYVKVDHKKAMRTREKRAIKKGEKPNYSSVSIDGWDMSATFDAQSKWNAFGAFFAALSVLCSIFS
ncbi:hypothetical protein Q5X62_03495 [Acinetobacter baumannii]|nr:hypothetical protein [Acinetobacter baumannii]